MKAKSLLGVYLDCRRARPEWAAGLQQQADMALREFARRGDVKWVSLMTWAGANPRSLGPAVEDLAAPDDPETYSTAIEEACSARSVAVLHALKLNAADDFDHILMMAGRWLDAPTIGYLIDRGAKPNDRADGSSFLLDHTLDAMNSLDKDDVAAATGRPRETCCPCSVFWWIEAQYGRHPRNRPTHSGYSFRGSIRTAR